MLSEFNWKAFKSSLIMIPFSFFFFSVYNTSFFNNLDCNITKFLNRILGLEVHQQNFLFQYFIQNFEYLIEKDKKEGKYDMGILGKQMILYTQTVAYTCVH